MTCRRLSRGSGKWLLAILPGLLLLASGCAQEQPYVSGYSFYPKPAIVDVYHRDGGQQTPVTVLASVLGVRQADPKHQIPYSIAVRLRLENNGATRVTFDPHTLELVTGTLRAFSPPIADPPQVVALTRGQRQDVTAYFPFPPNTTAQQISLGNLRLRWEIRVDNYAVPQSALFQRVPRDYNSDAHDTDLYY